MAAGKRIIGFPVTGQEGCPKGKHGSLAIEDNIFQSIGKGDGCHGDKKDSKKTNCENSG